MSLEQNDDQSDPPNKGSNSDDPIIIKKYSNRRLYNTEASKYIVLSDVVELINAGKEFRIEDAKSGEDITRTILNQIIFEQETRPSEFLFPLEFQKQLIRLYGDSYGQLFPSYLTQSIQYFNAERSKMADAWQDMMTHNAEHFLKQSQALAKQNMEMFQKSWDLFGIMSAQEPKEAAEQADQNEPLADEEPVLESLQSQLDALQAQIKAMKE